LYLQLTDAAKSAINDGLIGVPVADQLVGQYLQLLVIKSDCGAAILLALQFAAQAQISNQRLAHLQLSAVIAV